MFLFVLTGNKYDDDDDDDFDELLDFEYYRDLEMWVRGQGH